MDETTVGAGPLGLLVLVLLAVATVLLIRNMNQRLKRLPKEFPPPGGQDRGQDPDGPPAGPPPA